MDTGGQFLVACEPYMSTLRKVSGLQDQQLVTMLSKDKHLVGVYVEDVLLREALAAIFQAFIGDTYDNANTECCSVLDSSRLRAMHAACAIGAAKKDTLNKKYQHLVGK
ncbi:hypothetical protein DPMN_138502 [Dreissena polymorpha]|uniref:Uncharacterized protein n=1 Tax=Dreissena polymorpha TaxID=45954 RepID=A0A9D4G792_DREPO|nr:hypothetical protein DPMN_138502 [Dreissena polymorpha]